MSSGTSARRGAAAGRSSDEELVGLCQAGDKAVFSDLVQRYQGRIYNLAYRMLSTREDAQDVTQETFLHVYRALPSFRGARFSAWIYKIASNLCLDRLRRRRIRMVSLDAPDDASGEAWREIADARDLPEEVFTRAEAAADVQQAIQSLAPKYRLVVVLRHFYDLSYEEICQVTSLPLGTVKTRLFRARDILRKRLSTQVSS